MEKELPDTISQSNQNYTTYVRGRLQRYQYALESQKIDGLIGNWVAVEVNTKRCSDEEKRIRVKIITYLRHEADNDIRDGGVGWSVFRRAMDEKFARKMRRCLPAGENGNAALYNYMNTASNRVRYEILYAKKPNGDVDYTRRLRVRAVQGHSDKLKNGNKGGAGQWDFRTQYHVDPKKYPVVYHATDYRNFPSIRQKGFQGDRDETHMSLLDASLHSSKTTSFDDDGVAYAAYDFKLEMLDCIIIINTEIAFELC